MKGVLPDPIGRLLAAPELVTLAQRLAKDRVAAAYGLWGSSSSAVVASVRAHLHRPVLFICGHLDEADDIADDVELFTGVRPAVLASLETAGNLGRVSEEQASDRMRLTIKLASDKQPSMIVAPVQALMQPVPAKDELKHLTRHLGKGMMLEPEKLIVWLSDHGYNRVEQCEIPGDFAVRGGIIDIYLPGDLDEASDLVGLPVRVDFFGDQIESFKRFDLDTLGSGEPLQEVTVVDIKGQMSATTSQTHLFAYLAEQAVVILHQPLEIQEQARSYLERIPDQRGITPSVPFSATPRSSRCWR